MTPSFIKSFPATAAIAGYLIVKLGSSGVAPATASTDALVGTADAMGADLGGMADIVQGGWGEVRVGGNVAAGAPLTSDSESRAVTAAPVAGTVVRIIGFAMTDGAEDDIIPYLVAPSVLATPAA